MLISHGHKFIFLKTIKTAGSSLEIALQRVLLPGVNNPSHLAYEGPDGIIGARGESSKDQRFWNHMGAKAVYEEVGFEVFNRYRRASAIRNPFDKIVSWFFFGFHKRSEFSADREAFNAFVGAADRFPIDRGIYTIGGAICCEYFVRFEHLQADADELIRSLTNGKEKGLHLGTEKSGNRDKSIPYQAYYSPTTKSLVSKAFEFELENFGYKFDG